MKIFNKYSLTLVFLLISQLSFSEDVADTSGIILTASNDIIYMSGSASVTKEGMTCKDLDGKSLSYRQKDIKFMLLGNRIFFLYPRKKSGKDFQLMELIAVNKRYLLLQYWYDWNHIFIYDHNDNMIVEETDVYDRGATIGSKKNNQKAINLIEEYFGQCKEMITQLNYNFENSQTLTAGVEGYDCDGTFDLSVMIEKFKKKSFD